MPHQSLVAVLILAATCAGGESCDATELTTEELRARSPLAAALNARVHPPAEIPTTLMHPSAGPIGGPIGRPSPPPPPVDAGKPPWLQMLTPRSMNGQRTEVTGGDLSTSELDLQSTHGLRGVPPFVTVTPGLNLLLVDGPSTSAFPAPGPDLPSRLWGLSAQFTATMPLSEQWIAQVGLSPGIYTDFDHVSSDSFRMPGRLLGIYKYSARTQFTVGAVYLDREDLSWLPAFGVIHKPTDRTTFEFILPRPKVIQRFWGTSWDDGGFGYIAGELGGGSWAIERHERPGVPTDDVATLSDLRLLAGFEWKRNGGMGLLAETGWVFNRDVEYESGVGDADFDDAWLFRVGLRR
ncbi:DUF6268 family outer membrane beta-barrel protein [Alienimonas chondri]|uniref:DUF6268 domain-containing protein n=1 Tax=Alienimonas chondri TaxID=2681879 RepID=A0ABX1V8P0_9PLAN|nr:DUF6268 family outer membrane beta-barrel protein [Alienimonas chondri]NNJ24479.1 hypothetical protein [Alienimonas chondri]